MRDVDIEAEMKGGTLTYLVINSNSDFICRLFFSATSGFERFHCSIPK